MSNIKLQDFKYLELRLPKEIDPSVAESKYFRAGGKRYTGRSRDTENVNDKKASDVQSRAYAFYENGAFIGAMDDGLSTEAIGGGSPSVTRNPLTSRLIVGGSAGVDKTSRIYSGALGQGEGTWDINYELVLPLKVVFSGTSHAKYLFFGLNNGGNGTHMTSTARTSRHIGFIVERSGSTDTVYATNADGTTQTITAMSNVTPTNKNIYLLIFRAGDKVSFYVNDLLGVEHTTNLPSGTSNLPNWDFSISSKSSSTNEIRLFNNYELFTNII